MNLRYFVIHTVKWGNILINPDDISHIRVGARGQTVIRIHADDVETGLKVPELLKVLGAERVKHPLLDTVKVGGSFWGHNKKKHDNSV